jgi:hypothetical protein
MMLLYSFFKEERVTQQRLFGEDGSTSLSQTCAPLRLKSRTFFGVLQ